MRRLVRRLHRGACDERGAVAIVVAISLVSLLVIAGMVLDFGLARLDRQVNKSAADDAVAAGIRAFDQGTGDVYSFQGVCAALDFLKSNITALGSLSWTSNCSPTSPALQKVCKSSDNTTWADYTGSANGYTVRIENPYTLPDAAFPEDSLPSTSSDIASDPCDQLAVIITQKRHPGLGSLANASQLATTVRSVGRVGEGPGKQAPALILLDRTHCGVLVVGSGGSPSRIIVKGGDPIPATIHSDSDASDGACGTGPNQQLFQGHQTDGIVAYGAVDGGVAKSGSITSVASELNKDPNVVSDGISNVHGASGEYPTMGTSTGVTGRELVTRYPVDERYLPGVKAATMAAYSQWTLDHSSPSGYVHYGCPTAAQMTTTFPALTVTDSVYIDCPGNSGMTLNGTIGAGRIYFHGYIKGGALNLPNAQTIYIDDTDNSGARVNDSAIVLNNGTAFCMRATGCTPGVTPPDPAQCSTTSVSATAKAQLIIRRGNLNGAGGSLLRLCNTTVIMEGGQIGDGSATNPGGCLPPTYGTSPTATPCSGLSDTRGTGQINTSGQLDWTAPNSIGDMDTAVPALSAAGKQALWDGGEDLALWDESYGGSSNPSYTMAGGGNMHVSGVFMVPNAAPFHITGSGAQDLTNAQYIVTSFTVGGGATLTMAVDPHNAVSPNQLNAFTMVR